MAYELYNIILSKEEYFSKWTGDNVASLTEELKEDIYQKYMLKCKVLKRDNFTCQNDKCPFCHNKQYTEKLTIHHIKWQKNGGEHKERNMVTLCKSIHSGYHKAKHSISFPNNSLLPVHIKGHTFKVNKEDEINWKEVKAQMKKLRKELKHQHINLTWNDLNMLMRWLYHNYECE